MSESSKSRFKSKLPRPVQRPSIVNKRNEDVKSKTSVSLISKLTNEPALEKGCKPNCVTSKQMEPREEIDCSGDDFEADPKALESILSNKLITDELLSNRPSTALQLQGIRRSSMYYQSDSRMSMMDSHTQFKEKMKFLKEQMKLFNIKCGGTPKANLEKTPNKTTSGRPASLYYQAKPSQRKPSTPIQTTPVASQIQHSSMSERKLLAPREPYDNRLCHTVSKLDSKPSGLHQHSIPGGKENKVRFKLFPSPIHEVTETTSPQSEETSTPNVMKTCLKSYKDSSKVSNVSETSNTTQEVISDSKNSATSSELKPSTPQVPVPSSTYHPAYSNNCPPVMSASTVSTWTIKDSICTPKSLVFTPVNQKNNESAITPQHIASSTHKMKGNLVERSQANTPSRIVCYKSEHKAPQRTIVSESGVKFPKKDPQHTVEALSSVNRLPLRVKSQYLGSISK